MKTSINYFTKPTWHSVPFLSKSIFIGFFIAMLLMGTCVSAQINFSGSNAYGADNQHDGGYRWVVGVQEHALTRPTNNTGSAAAAMAGHSVTQTRFNHHPFLTHWQGKFWIYYIGYQHEEATKAGYLHWSTDGRTWNNGDKTIIFPAPLATHQRMAFYTASNGILLVSTWFSQNGEIGRGGIGSRLIREIKGPNNYGAIHILKQNQDGGSNANYPLYTSSSDNDFKNACAELLANDLYMQQMWEEDEDNSASGPYVIKGQGNNSDFEAKAFTWHRLPNNRIIGNWKGGWMGYTSGSEWTASEITRTINLNIFGEHRNAKMWGEQKSNGGYAMFFSRGVQNLPGTKPWYGFDSRTPLAVSTSSDGLNFTTDLLTVSGDNGKQLFRNGSADNKTLGPSYVRGIQWLANKEDKTRPNDNMWITYSTNKEFIWVAEVPKNITGTVSSHVNDQFASWTVGGRVGDWNIRNGSWTPVQLVSNGSATVLRLQDKDPYDFAKAFRVFPESSKVTITTTITPLQNNSGELHIELVNKTGKRPVRLRFSADGTLRWQNSSGNWNSLGSYSANQAAEIIIAADTETSKFAVYRNGNLLGSNLSLAESVSSVERVEYRTGPSLMKDFSTNAYGGGSPGYRTSDLPGAHDPVTLARFDVAGLKTVSGIDNTPSHTITATAGPNGSISPSGSVTVADGNEQSFTITPNSGYQIANVLVNGSSVGAVSSYTFSNVSSTQTISASFSQIPVSTYPIIHSYSVQASNAPASQLIDGSLAIGDRWSAEGMPQWVIVDYGEVKNITGTRLFTYQNRAYQYKIEMSEDLTFNEPVVVDRLSNTDGSQPISDDFNAVSARYVKITVEGASGYSGDWVSLIEFEIEEGTGSIPAKVVRLQNVHSNLFIRHDTEGRLYMESRNNFDDSYTTVKWRLEDAGDGYVRLKNIYSSNYLRHKDGRLYMESQDNFDDSYTTVKWKLENVNSNIVRLQNVHSKMYLRHKDGTLFMELQENFESHYTTVQWKLEATSANSRSEVTSEKSTLESTGKNDIVLYPNPVTNGMLKIEGLAENATIRVYSIVGTKLLEKQASGHLLTLNLPVTTGAVLISISQNDTITWHKVIVE